MSTPRPTFDAPTVIRRGDTAHHVWGDVESGHVTDRVYVSTSALHVLEFELAPGGGFRHSPANKTVFAADVFYGVLAGTLVIADPEHGEVRVVEAGEGVLFRRDTWHHGFNPSAGDPPSTGVLRPAAQQGHRVDLRPNPGRPGAREVPGRAMGASLAGCGREQQAASKLHQVRETDALWRFAHEAPSHLQGTLVDTEHLLVRTGRVAAGHVEDLHEVEDETVIVATSGQLWVDTLDSCTGDFAVACLDPGDAAFVPAGSSMRVLVRSAAPATYLLGAGRLTPDDWTPVT